MHACLAATAPPSARLGHIRQNPTRVTALCLLLVESGLVWRPRIDWSADFPLVTEWINDPTDPPTVPITYRGYFGGPDTHSSVQYGFRIVDHEEGPARRSADRLRAESVHTRAGGDNPEPCALHAKLCHDVVSVADAVEDRRPERRLIEVDCRIGFLYPQLRLDPYHAIHSRIRPGSSEQSPDRGAAGRSSRQWPPRAKLWV